MSEELQPQPRLVEGVIVGFHLSDDAIALDPERLDEPTLVGPFDTLEEADAFRLAHRQFYAWSEVIDPWDLDLTSPEKWIAEEEENGDAYEGEEDDSHDYESYRERESRQWRSAV